jgi:hypothetical protein
MESTNLSYSYYEEWEWSQNEQTPKHPSDHNLQLSLNALLNGQYETAKR